MSETIVVNSRHPAWDAIDDDDWNGATFSNWLSNLGDCHVILKPSKEFDSELVQRMYNIVLGCAKSVTIEEE